MKKFSAVFLILLFALLFISCSPENSDEKTVQFHDKILYKADLSQDTIEWLEWYNDLSENEQLSISYIPSDLYRMCGYGTAEDVSAE